jgi:uncharacterized protein (TIGR04222 family)
MAPSLPSVALPTQIGPRHYGARVRTKRFGFVILIATALALALSTVHAGPARAQVGEVIHRYEVHITMEPSGDLRITERIAYDFGATPKHGILRQIPTRFHYDGRFDRVEPISDVSVTASPGTPATTKVETGTGGRTVIRVGDKNRTITGTHTYDLSYRVRGVLNPFEDHDELYWNAIGVEWSVVIESAVVQVTAPVTIDRVACFAGPAESRLSCAESGKAGSSATFSQNRLFPRSGMTVVVGVPKGAVTVGRPILKERWSLGRAFALTPTTIGGAAGLAVLFFGSLFVVLWRGGRDRRFRGGPVEVAYGKEGGAEEPVPIGAGRHVPVEFEPPDKLRPGELGTLVDMVANPLDVTATIVDLAVRGYLRIEEIPKHGWLGKADWKMVQARPPDDKLKRYERTLLDGIFESGSRPEVKLSELRNTFASKLHEVQGQLYDDAMEQGWFVRRPDRVRGFWVAMGVLASVVGIAVLVVLTITTHVALLGVPVALGGLLLLGAAHWMPRRTAKGYGVLQRARGFKRFIDESEKERARFAERKNLFSEYLPYAVVFGATEKWAHAFAGLDGQLPDTGGWYVSPNPFTFAVFAASLDGFTTTTAGTIASTPGTSGSSGFSGGFSGGGGGGGGGGSW